MVPASIKKIGKCVCYVYLQNGTHLVVVQISRINKVYDSLSVCAASINLGEERRGE